MVDLPRFEEIQALVKAQMQATEVVMQAEMTSEVPLAELVMAYALGAGETVSPFAHVVKRRDVWLSRPAYPNCRSLY